MKTFLKVLGAIIVAVVAFILAIYFSFNHFNTTSGTAVVDGNVGEANVFNVAGLTVTVGDEVVEASYQSIVGNKITDVNEIYDMFNNGVFDEPRENIYDSNVEVGSTDLKQQAIDLVKQNWGADSSVTFRCDSINEKGEYIIAVVSKDKATVQSYFRVNLNNKTVEMEY